MGERIDLFWWLSELFLTYKYGDKQKFSKALDVLAPYLDDILYECLVKIERDSLFLRR